MRTKLRVVEEDGVALEDAAEGGRLDLAVASLVVQRKRVPQLHGSARGNRQHSRIKKSPGSDARGKSV